MNTTKDLIRLLKNNKELKEYTNNQKLEKRKEIRRRHSITTPRKLLEAYKTSLEYGKYRHLQNIENNENQKHDRDIRTEQGFYVDYLLEKEQELCKEYIKNGMPLETAREAAGKALTQNIKEYEALAKNDASKRMELIRSSRRNRHYRNLVQEFGKDIAKTMIETNI